MKNIIIYLVILLVVLFGIWTSLNLNKFIKPKLSDITNVEVLGINKDSVLINVEAGLINNFFFKIEINEINLKILNGEDTIGTVNSYLKKELAGYDNSKLNLPAKFSTAKLAEILGENSDLIKLKLKGLINLKIFFLNKNLGISEELNIALKSSLLKAIEKVSKDEETTEKIIEIKSAKLIDVGLQSSKVLIEFTVKNPYDIPIILISYPADIYLNDNYAGKGNLKDQIELNNNGDIASGEFEFELENIAGIKSILKTIFTTRIIYKTVGDLHLSVLGYKIKIPYSITGDLIKL